MTNFKDVPISKRMGYEVKIFRESKGWTQAKMGKYTDLNRTRICDLERGKTICNMETLSDLAKVCGEYVIYMVIMALWGTEGAHNQLKESFGEEGYKHFLSRIEEQGPVHQLRAYDSDEKHMRSDKEQEEKL